MTMSEAKTDRTTQAAHAELLREDMIWCLGRLPTPVLKLLRKREGIFLAGGYIRARVCGEAPNDIDLFAPSRDAAEAAARSLINSNASLIVTDNAYTVKGYGLPVQFIHRWAYGDPRACIDEFDFTIARAAIWRCPWWGKHGRWESACHERFYQDVAAKRLVYCTPERDEDAGGSMLRVLKFYQRGYRIPLDSLGRVIGRLMTGVAEHDECPEDIAIRAMKSASIAKCVTDLLREVDPEVDPDHFAYIPKSEEEADQLA